MQISRRSKPSFGVRLCGLAVLPLAAHFLIAPSLFAYVRHLTDSEVREAYLFGQRHDVTVGKFFDQYEKKIPPAGSGPHVRAIGVRTPYSAVVLRSYQGGSTYSAQKAWKDYTVRARVFEVVVWIDIPLRSPAPQTRAFDPTVPIQQMFTVEFSSQERVLAAQKTLVVPQYFSAGDSSALTGVDMHFEYDVRDVASAPALVQVTGPDGNTVSANFDLGSLR